MQISSNGYITFSGEQFGYGNTRAIHDDAIPNDMVAAFWTDLDPSRSHNADVYTWATTGSNCMHGIAGSRGALLRLVWPMRWQWLPKPPRWPSRLLRWTSARQRPACSDNGRQGLADGRGAVVGWSNIPSFCGPPGMRAGQPLGMAANCGQLDQSTSTFQMIPYPSGRSSFSIRTCWRRSIGRRCATLASAPASAWRTVYYPAGTYAKVSIGIENAAGGEGLKSPMTIRHSRLRTRPTSSRRAAAPRSGLLAWLVPSVRLGTCDYQYADTVCKSVYGGQLATPRTQQDYDLIAGLVGGPSVHAGDHPCEGCNSQMTNNGDCGCGCAGRSQDGSCNPATETYNEQYLLGYHADGNGNWESTDTHGGDRECHTAPATRIRSLRSACPDWKTSGMACTTA